MSSDAAMQGGMYIALAAPSGVGKTSVLTALLAEANEVLAGTRVSVEPTGQTRKRLNKLENELNEHIRSKQFVTGGIRSTQDTAQASLEIRAIGTDHKFKLEILDYPGELLEKREGDQWNQVRKWFQRADVLILPVDATLLMEATTPAQKKRVRDLLNLAEMTSVAAREWAKGRSAAKLGPGLLVLAPVKGETYFADNGGTSDRSDELWLQVKSVYAPVIEAVNKEAAGITVMYCPIDTIGCVEMMRVEWPAAIAHYRVRGEPQLRRKGAADLFVALVGRMLAEASQQQQQEAERVRQDAQRRQGVAEEDRGVFGNFWWWINGTRAELRKDAAQAGSRAAGEEAALAELQRTLEQIRNRPMHARVRLPGV